MILSIEIKWLRINIKIIIVQDIKCTNKLLLQDPLYDVKDFFHRKFTENQHQKAVRWWRSLHRWFFLGKGCIFLKAFIGTFT